MIKILRNIFLKKKTLKVEIISAGEKICRFSSHKSKISTKRDELKYTAFIPPKNAPSEVSVLRIDNLRDSDVWDIGDVLLCKALPKFRGDMKVKDIRTIAGQNIDVVSEPTPHYLHANIINIPTNVANNADEKARQKSVAVDLAKCSTLVKR